MANVKIKSLADAVNLQVAAEAFWGASVGANPILLDGNKNNSREPNKVIQKEFLVANFAI